MQDYARGLYKSKEWQRIRTEYIKKVGGLCERCYAAGRIRAGVIVHHKDYVTPSNVRDPSIVLNSDNLELLCQECHNKEHSRQKRRYCVDSGGRVAILPD